MIRRKMSLLALAMLLAASPALSAKPARHHRRPSASWFEYRVFVPSRENLRSQNAMIDQLGLPRIQSDDALREFIGSADLVPVTENKYVRVSPRLEAKRRFCRPSVDLFLQELGAAYYAEFGEPIQVNSAVRTVKTQLRLLRWNHNAAPAHGETASAHLAGVAVDLQRRGLTRPQIRFIQTRLLFLAGLQMVIVEEELRQPCFHVVVTGEYPSPPQLNFIPPDTGVIDGILGIRR
jgi:hypothetical protein